MELLNKIINRMSELGYPIDPYFPEIKKIIHIVQNSKDKNLSNVDKRYIYDCTRRAYELGIMDKILDDLIDELYQKSN